MTDHDDRISTLHPAGKRGVRIERSKYEPMRSALHELVTDDEHGVALSTVRARLPEVLRRVGFPEDASVSWFMIAVKQDLEARGELEIVPGARPQRLRLTSKDLG